MELSDSELSHLEHLSRLRLPDAERDAMRRDIGAILHYVSSLQKIDTEGIDLTYRGVEQTTPLRIDQVQPFTDSVELLSSAPDVQDGHIRVPATLQHKSTEQEPKSDPV